MANKEAKTVETPAEEQRGHLPTDEPIPTQYPSLQEVLGLGNRPYGSDTVLLPGDGRYVYPPAAGQGPGRYKSKQTAVAPFVVSPFLTVPR